MKKIITLYLIFVVLALFLASCSDNLPALPHEDPQKPEITHLKPETPKTPDNAIQNQAEAYFAVFESLYEMDTALNEDSIYLALDLTGAKLSDQEYLIEIFEDFCSQNEYTLLLDTSEGLKEKGYIDTDNLYFKQGFLISFNDSKLTNNTLVTDAMKWSSGLGAVGAEYTVKLKDGVWKITDIDDEWIS